MSRRGVMVGRTDRVDVRCSARQRARWEAAARRANRSLADWIRLALDQAERALGAERPATADGEETSDWADVAAIGVVARLHYPADYPRLVHRSLVRSRWDGHRRIVADALRSAYKAGGVGARDRERQEPSRATDFS